MEVNISKQIIDQRVNALMREHTEWFEDKDEELRRSGIFLMLGVAAYLDMDITETMSYITDGGNDGGMDAVYIEETHDGQVDVIMFQSKYVRDFDKESNFPANAVEKAVNTVRMVFDPDNRIELNEESRRKVDEIRSLILDGNIPYVTFVMLNNGLTWKKEAQDYIDNVFGGQEQVRFEHFGYREILGFIEKKSPINAQINLTGAAIEENFNYKRVILGKVNVSEICSLMDRYGDSLLERNIRKYLGRNAINEDIAMSLLSDNRANFFFYNNGITIICEKFSYNALQNHDWMVRTSDMQIINGGQTCRAIQQTLNNNPGLDTGDVYVLVRIYEVNDDEDIVRNITYATNHQNPVDLRDLKSNTEDQINLEEGASMLGYVYKRKRDNSSPSNAIPSSVAAEAVFAIWRLCPHLAKYKKGDLFGAYYKDIFSGLNAAQMIMATAIFRYCDANRRKSSDDPDIRAVRAYSNYMVSCMVGQRLLRDRGIKINELTHRNFDEVKGYFEEHKKELLNWAENTLIKMLYDYFALDRSNKTLAGLDGRTMATAFRRYDLVERYIKNEEWWKE